MESEELTPPPSPSRPRLKIKLKLPQILSPNEPSSRAASTPSGEGQSQPPFRRGISKGTVVIVSISVAEYFQTTILNQRTTMRWLGVPRAQ